MSIERPTVAIVDGYSTGMLLAPEFTARGWRPVHVQSMPETPAVFLPSYRPEDYAARIIHGGDIGATVAALSAYRPAAIVTGAETGVEVADALCAAFGLPGNDPARSRARRDKFEMIETLRHHGLRTARQFRSGDRDAVVAWARANGDWPVVVKPLDSAGTDGVTFCHDEDAVARAFDMLHGRPNRMGFLNAEILVQSFLRGVQYFINAVSHEGRHVIGEVWREDKRMVADAAFINDLEVLIPKRGSLQAELIDYTARVLDALGIRHGPSHNELMLTEDGPVLVETAARMQGSVDHTCIVEALGYSQVTLTVDCYANPAALIRRLEDDYAMRSHVYCVALISEQEGVIRDVGGVRRLEALPSYYSRLRIPAVGDVLHPTVDLFSSPGIVYLLHEDEEVLKADYRRIREWEKSGALFAV